MSHNKPRGQRSTKRNCDACGRYKMHESRGLCKSCYEWKRINGKLDEWKLLHKPRIGKCQAPGCGNADVARGLCSTHISRTRFGQPLDDPLREQHPRTEERFWASVDTSGGPEACWPWTGDIDDKGYGRAFKAPESASRHQGAYRIAWFYTFGEVPSGLHLDHVCHTEDVSCRLGSRCPHRRCCNPSHLEPVTPGENTRRGRQSLWKPAWRASCDDGHPLSGDNLILRGDGAKRCRQCHAGSAARSNRKQAAS